MSSSLLKRTAFTSESAIFPSTLIAALMITRGRTPIRWAGRITTLRAPAKFIYGGDLAPPAKLMQAHLLHLEGILFFFKQKTAYEILFDGGEAESRRGPSPVQATLLATMACTASDVVSILRKERVPFRALEIEAEAERAKDIPKVFTKIRLHYRVRGDNIQEAAIKRAIDLSSEKYCTVGIMLRRAGVEFGNTHEILPME